MEKARAFGARFATCALPLHSTFSWSDPVTFVMRMTRAYNPSLWHALEDLGVGHLLVQAGRERELANVYRASDAARVLNDADFAAVLEFTRSAFDTAVKFRADARKR